MLYLPIKIIFCLLSAGLIGLVVGWWWTRQTERRRSMELEGVWTQKVQRSNRELEALRADLRTEATRTQSAVDAESSLKGRLISIESEHQSALDKMAGFTSKLTASEGALVEAKSSWASESAIWKVKYATVETTLAAKESSLSAAESALSSARKDLGDREDLIADLRRQAAMVEPR